MPLQWSLVGYRLQEINIQINILIVDQMMTNKAYTMCLGKIFL